MPTLKDIAARAGVSRTTISLALKNHSSIPESTRKRIQKLAQDMGYHPSPHIATLMQQVRARQPVRHTGTLAWITAWPTRDGWRGRLFRDYFDGASERANQLGYRIEEFWAREPGMSGRRLTQILLARRIHGLLIAPLPIAKGHLTLDWSHFAAATMGYSLARPDLPRASVDMFNNVLVALRHLKRLGYRRPGLVQPVHGNERVNYLQSGALCAFQQKLPLADRVPLFFHKDWDEVRYRKWIRKHRPDSVLGGGRELLEGIVRCGLRIGEDVGFVHLQLFGGEKHAGMLTNGKLTGGAAVDIVVTQLQHNEFGIPSHPRTVLVKGDWIDGPTVRRQ